jgi:hypothetical protein
MIIDTFTFLRDYSEEEKVEYSNLLRASINKLPFTLASSVAKLFNHLEKGEYGKSKDYALDFFEISVQYVSLLLIRLIQKEEETATTKNELLVQVVKFIDTKRPLSFGDWINGILKPLIESAKKTIPNNPLSISLNNYMKYNGGDLLLGGKKDTSIVQIRNDYKGHDTILSDNIYKDVLYTIELRIFQMLRAISPLQDFLYFSCNEQLDTGEFKVCLLNGNDNPKEKTIKTSQLLQAFHYYIQSASQELGGGELVDMFPLFFCNKQRYIYIFQTLKEENISYISSHENAAKWTSDYLNDFFDKLLQQTVPAFDISKELNWQEIRDLSVKTSQKFIENAYKEKKYNQELFVNRTKLSNYFQEFQRSDKYLLPLQGEAGQGKTNQLCYWTEQLIEQGKSVLVFNSSSFAESTLEEQLKNAFGFSLRKDIHKLLNNIHKKATDNDEFIYFFFDAINECLTYKGTKSEEEGSLSLYHDICSLLVKQEYSRFKTLFTCRSYTWKNLIQPDITTEKSSIFTAQEEIAVRGFTDEELEKAYTIYQDMYQMNTGFEELYNYHRSVAIRLKDPLMLKIASTNYLGINLPDDLTHYTSIALFEKMLQDISRSYTGKKQLIIIEGLASHILQEYETGNPADSISESVLRQAHRNKQSPLHSLAQSIYKKNGNDSVAYGELLNRPERPILRLTDNKGEKKLQFIYERFLEFMLASIFIKKEKNKLPDTQKTIPSEVFIKELELAHKNVVFIGAMRNALIMNNNMDVIADLEYEFGNNAEVGLLVRETIDVLIRENYEDEIFALISRLLDQQLTNSQKKIEQFNSVNKKIDSNQADASVIKEHNQLYKELLPLISLRKLAINIVVNGLFLTDYFKESLYRKDPFQLLWRLMTDSIKDVQNETCMYVYYLSNQTHTLNYSPLEENLTQRIISDMFKIIKNTPVVKIIVGKKTRQHSVIFLETAIRLSVIMIVEATRRNDYKHIEEQLNEIKSVLRHFTFNFHLLKLMMPLFDTIARRQITFQSNYVNNINEYQTFWDESIIPKRSNDVNEWSRESFKKVSAFVSYYNQHHKNSLPAKDKDFIALHRQILSAYSKGDSFSYFLLERILAIMGISSWDNIRPIVVAFFGEEYYRGTEWFDYSQMSMLYVLYQVAVYIPEANEELIEYYSRESEIWTRNCKGLFKARNSHKTNSMQKYRRNVMNWYCVVYCRHTGDNITRQGDEKCVPVFYKLIDEALAQNDKELLYHLIENISELASDNGYILTALDLLKYILTQMDADKINSINNIKIEHRDKIYQENFISLCVKTLSTVKNYFPVEVNRFVEKELSNPKISGREQFRSDILNYNSSGETLSDLLTHKVGNFIIPALLNEEAVDKFIYEVMSMAVEVSDCIHWFDKLVRALVKSLFKIKL